MISPKKTQKAASLKSSLQIWGGSGVESTQQFLICADAPLGMPASCHISDEQFLSGHACLDPLDLSASNCRRTSDKLLSSRYVIYC